MRLVEASGVAFLVFEQLWGQGSLRHGVSLREGRGGIDFDFLKQDRKQREFKVDNFCRALGLSADGVVQAHQVHGAEVAVADGPQDKPGPADGLCTNRAGVSLMLWGADCPLILLYDPVGPALGLAHAGWRGTVGRITAGLVERMAGQFGSDPGKMRVGIGPGICGDCYEVGEEVAQEARKKLGDISGFLQWRSPGDSHRTEKRWYFDLAQANRRQLLEAQVPAGQIELSGCCTYEQGQWFPSHRREGKGAGRWALLAGLRATDRD